MTKQRIVVKIRHGKMSQAFTDHLASRIRLYSPSGRWARTGDSHAQYYYRLTDDTPVQGPFADYETAHADAVWLAKYVAPELLTRYRAYAEPL